MTVYGGAIDSMENGYNLVHHTIPAILKIKEFDDGNRDIEFTDEKIAKVRDVVLSSLGNDGFISERFVDIRVSEAIQTAFKGEDGVEVNFASTLKPDQKSQYGLLIVDKKEI